MDLISRQAAIEEIKAVFEWHDTVTMERMIEHFNNLPSAQPEKRTENTRKTHGVCLDTISRKAAIDAIMDADVCVTWNGVISDDDAVDIAIKSTKGSVISSIVNMPSAQPEHTSNNDCNGCKFVGCYDTDFPCANCIRKNKDYYAPERRTDEHDDIFE